MVSSFPQASALESTLAKSGESWGIPNTDWEPGKIRWLARGNPEEMPHIKYTEAQLSLTPSMCAYSHVLFLLPNKHLFHHFPSLCWNSFLQSRQARALPVATGPHGLVVGIWSSHYRGLASVSGQGTDILLPLTANQGHPKSVRAFSSRPLGPWGTGAPRQGQRARVRQGRNYRLGGEESLEIPWTKGECQGLLCPLLHSPSRQTWLSSNRFTTFETLSTTFTASWAPYITLESMQIQSKFIFMNLI